MRNSAVQKRKSREKQGRPVRIPGFLIPTLAAALLLPPVMFMAQDLDVPALRRELERESSKLNEIRLRIQNAENVVKESKRAHSHSLLVWNEYQQDLHGPDPKNRRVLDPLTLHSRALSEKEIYNRAYDRNPFTAPTGRMRVSVFGEYVESMSRKAEDAKRSLPQLNQDLDAQQQRVDFWNWQLVAAGAAADPLPGTWKLDLAGQITLVTVYRDPKGRYAGVINASGLEHFPSGATLFSVVLDRRNPYSYSGTQTGYTHLKRDRREDEPLFLKVSGDRLAYRLGRQALTWMRVGN